MRRLFFKSCKLTVYQHGVCLGASKVAGVVVAVGENKRQRSGESMSAHCIWIRSSDIPLLYCWFANDTYILTICRLVRHFYCHCDIER